MLSQLTSVCNLILARVRRSGEEGASLVEYALILAFVVVVAIGAMALLGGSTANLLNTSGNAISNP